MLDIETPDRRLQFTAAPRIIGRDTLPRSRTELIERRAEQVMIDRDFPSRIRNEAIPVASLRPRTAEQGVDLASEQAGRIVPILTRAIHPPVPKGMVAYLPNKAAMLEFSRYLEVEYQKQGIHSFCVEPSFMESAYTKNWPEGIRLEAEKSLSTEPRVLAAKVLARCLETSVGSGGSELQG